MAQRSPTIEKPPPQFRRAGHTKHDLSPGGINSGEPDAAADDFVQPGWPAADPEESLSGFQSSLDGSVANRRRQPVPHGHSRMPEVGILSVRGWLMLVD